MAYTCPTCSGTGKVTGTTCPTCLGNKTLIEDSQGASVTFLGNSVAPSITTISITPATCSSEDTTSLNATAINGVIVRRLEVCAITPGTADIGFIGEPNLGLNDIGKQGALAISWKASDYALTAFLADVSMSGSVGSLITGSLKFQIV